MPLSYETWEHQPSLFEDGLWVNVSCPHCLRVRRMLRQWISENQRGLLRCEHCKESSKIPMIGGA